MRKLATSAKVVSVPDFASTWCGAPWLWTGLSAEGCAGQHHNVPTQ